MHPDFACHARAALDAVFAHLGQWVAVHSAARGRHECRALLAGEDRETEFGSATLVSRSAVLEFRVEDAPARGDAVALLDGPGGAETERRVVTTEPQATDALRLTVRVATAPERPVRPDRNRRTPMPMGLDIGTSFASAAARARTPACAQPDADAAAYVAAVEAADGQALEPGVRAAVDAFVAGCKADGVWNAIGAACVLAAARTLAGALTPLKGPAPTNVNFVSGDYDRKTGLKGDGTSKYVDTNRAGNADPLTDFHAAVWQTSLQTSAGSNFGPLIASRLSDDSANSSQIIDSDNTDVYQLLVRGIFPTEIGFRAPRVANRLVAMSLSGATLTLKYADALDTETVTALGSVSATWQVFGRGDGERHSEARLPFYSIGTSINLAQLDARVAALMTAIGEAVA